jgi:3-deoxy-D-manno-octulosonate 8-phosphate phosphatase (KDO 8-P phosphatase)
MSTINYDLKKIKAFIFDVDGVLSPDSVPLSPEGVPVRLVNIKDGYAINRAVNAGYGVAIITGADTENIRFRFNRLGVKDIYLKSKIKMKDLSDYMEKTGYRPEEITYAGDDLPDYEIMKAVGLGVAPANAVPEIKSVARYISHKNGGDGVARDVIEQVMKAQGEWMTEDMLDSIVVF